MEPPIHRPGNLISSPIVYREIDVNSIILPGILGNCLDFRAYLFGQTLDISGVVELDPVFSIEVVLIPEVSGHQAHNEGHFLLRSAPVLRGEGVEGEVLDAEIDGGQDDTLSRLDALAVTLCAGQVPLDRPSAVTIHDNADVARWVREQAFLGHQISRISFSFSARASLIFSTWASVSF